jgi:FMN reductase
MPATLAVLTAGIRQPSATALLADRLAGATVHALQRSGMTARLVGVELRPYATALADAMVTGQVPPELARVVDSVTGADGLIAVTPTFAGSYAGLFKSFFDVLDRRALVGMPVLLGATGGSARHSLVIEYAMRPLLSYFYAVIAPTGVFAAPGDLAEPPSVGDPGDAAHTGTGTAADRLAERIDRAAGEMAELVVAAMPREAARARGAVGACGPASA